MNEMKGFALSTPLLTTSSITNRGKTFFNRSVEGADCVLQRTEVKFEVKDKDLESQESMMDLYERWMTHFGIFRVDPLEKWTRFEIFKETVKKNRAANIFADGRRRERCRSITGDHRHFFDSRKQSASGKVREE
ncbi:hypothetical protein C5167_013526 [Papaver somniferum]|uniref:Cathepsin propeptide inhibitor domain-containing protein n=1 Tax=Papaver somniferum TaxID=3469 RepID=A0A4Y7J2J1_PAPSO|nr:hypothetical protein C5167_013526 [Papaver somniferum]